MGREPAWLRRNTRLGPNTILDVLAGITRTPSAPTLEKLAQVLGVPPAWLTADVPQRRLTETEHDELLQCVQTLRALARGTRIDVRADPNVQHEPARAVPHQFKLLGAREVYRARGASMSGFGLMDGDLVYAKPLARPSIRDAVGSLVVLRLNGALFLKQLIVAARGKIVLRSAHPGYDPLTIHKHDNLELSGQVVASVREFGRKR
jgi:SOS-response transcriptional repressor LexA